MVKKEKFWKTVKEKIIHKSYGGKFFHNKVLNPQKQKSTYSYYYINRGASVIPVDKKGNIYFLKEYRYPTRSWECEPIGGGISKGETPIMAARKELLEEAGIIAKKLTLLGKTKVMPGNLDTLTTGFLATNLQFATPNREVGEVQKLIKMPIKKAIEQALTGKIKNAELVTYILRAAKKLKKI